VPVSPLRTYAGALRRLREADARGRAMHVLRHRAPGLPRRGDVFNLDVHVAVIADVKAQLDRRGLSLVDWTLSGHSWTAGRERDPVAVVNERTWQQFAPDTPRRFQQAYAGYLRSFRGFVAAYPPCFALLYEGLGKPTLAIAATRYEWPFTHDAARWAWLDDGLRRALEDGWLVLAANNRADADYLEHYTGLRPAVLPGACAYAADAYTGTREQVVVCSPDDDLARTICDALSVGAIPLRAGLGQRYERADLYAHRALVYLPYNVSIMSLFEHYAAGAPVYIPERGFLKQLMRDHPQSVLSSISFCQVTAQPAARTAAPDLNDVRDDQVVDWYLDRADFYDPEWMPLIRQFESWSHLDHLLRTDDHSAISADMKASNRDRFARIADRYEATGWLDATAASPAAGTR
jgi:hypothetical protein